VCSSPSAPISSSPDRSTSLTQRCERSSWLPISSHLSQTAPHDLSYVQAQNGREIADMLVMVIGVGLVVGLVGRHRLRYAAPRATPVVFAAAGLQIVSTAAAGGAHGVLLVASFVLAVVWLGLQPRHLPTALLGIGAALNAVVILMNSGMPVDADALAAIGRSSVDVTQGFLYKHVPMTDATRLAWLGDRIPIPLQRNVISIGDVVMACAIALWLAGSVAGWLSEDRSTGAVHRKHRRRARGEGVALGELPQPCEHDVGCLTLRKPAMHFDG
jgi:hypothetical protein